MAEYKAQQERRRMLGQQDTPEMAREVREERDMSLDQRDKQDTPTNVPGTPTNPGSAPTKRAGKRKLTTLNPASTPGDPASTLIDAVSSPTDPSVAFTPLNRATFAPNHSSTLSNSNITPQSRERIDRDNDYLYDLRDRQKFPWPDIVAFAKKDRGLDLSILDAQQRVSQAVDRYRRGRPTIQSNLVQQNITPSTPVDSDENDEFFLHLKDRLNLTPREIVARAKERGLSLRVSDVTARVSRARNRRGGRQFEPQYDPLAKYRDGASGAAFSNPILIDSAGNTQSSPAPAPSRAAAPFLAPPMPPPAAPALPAPRDPTHPPAQSRAPAPFVAPPHPRNPGPHPMNPLPAPASAPPQQVSGPRPMSAPTGLTAPPIPTITALNREVGLQLDAGPQWLVEMHEVKGFTFAQIHELTPAINQGPLGAYAVWQRYQQTWQDVRDHRLLRMRDEERLTWEEIAAKFQAEQGISVIQGDVIYRYQRVRQMLEGGGR